MKQPCYIQCKLSNWYHTSLHNGRINISLVNSILRAGRLNLDLVLEIFVRAAIHRPNHNAPVLMRFLAKTAIV